MRKDVYFNLIMLAILTSLIPLDYIITHSYNKWHNMHSQPVVKKIENIILEIDKAEEEEDKEKLEELHEKLKQANEELKKEYHR